MCWIWPVCPSAEMLGGIETDETTLTYLKERKQFDTIIGTFQALQHRAAEMFCEVEICQFTCLMRCPSLKNGAMTARVQRALPKRACPMLRA